MNAPQTAILERQLQVIQHFPDLRFRIGSEILVDDPVNPSGQHVIEMRHQLDVIAIISPKLRLGADWRCPTTLATIRPHDLVVDRSVSSDPTT